MSHDPQASLTASPAITLEAWIKELDPIPQFKATAKLGEFLEDRF